MHGHGHGHSHALDARRADSRRRMWIALAINVGLLARRGRRRHPHRLAGGAGRRRAPALRRRLDRPGADRGPARARCRRRAGAPSATSAPRCWRRWSTGCCWSRSASRSRSPRSAASPTRPRSTAPACSPSALLGLAGNLAATWVLARGQREDINLEGVLRHSVADALGSLGVVVAGAFVLLGGSDDRRPDRRPADRRPRPRLLLAADQGAVRRADGGGAGRPRRRRAWARRSAREEGVRSVHDLHVWTVTAGFGALAAHVVVARGCDRDLIRRRLELTLARALRDRAHDPADGGGGRPGPAAGRERPRRSG